MSRTKGEGRSGAEKAFRVVQPKAVTRARRDKERAEEQEWAARSGPVTVTKKESQ